MQVVEKVTVNLSPMQFDSIEELELFFKSFNNAIAFNKYKYSQLQQGRIISRNGLLVSPSVYEDTTIYSSNDSYNYLKKEYQVYKIKDYFDQLGFTYTSSISYIYD